MIRLAAFLVTTLIASAVFAAGQPSCLPEFTALDVLHAISGGEPAPLKYSLRSFNGDRVYLTSVKVEGKIKPADHGARSLSLRFYFDEEFDGVSLPYNIYAVFVLQDGRPISWEDYTDRCNSPGWSFYPGQQVELAPIELPSLKDNDIQLIIWGR